MSSIYRFDSRVAVITGAGGNPSPGRTRALLLTGQWPRSAAMEGATIMGLGIHDTSTWKIKLYSRESSHV